MGEWCDAWSAVNKKNIWGIVPSVSELQSEGGASGSVWRITNWCLNYNIYSITRVVVNDSEYVQNSR